MASATRLATLARTASATTAWEIPEAAGAGEDAGAGCDRREDRDADRAADLVTGGVEA
jgi:hypothetical protein